MDDIKNGTPGLGNAERLLSNCDLNAVTGSASAGAFMPVQQQCSGADDNRVDGRDFLVWQRNSGLS
jgi:hypothetical protein